MDILQLSVVVGIPCAQAFQSNEEEDDDDGDDDGDEKNEMERNESN